MEVASLRTRRPRCTPGSTRAGLRHHAHLAGRPAGRDKPAGWLLGLGVRSPVVSLSFVDRGVRVDHTSTSRTTDAGGQTSLDPES
jgi:hypothetical protein